MSCEQKPPVCCNVCSKQQQIMKRCTRCKAVMYCSKDCQLKDWPAHKLSCNTLSTPTRNESNKFQTNDNSIFGETNEMQPKNKSGEEDSWSHPPLVDFSKALKTSDVIKPDGNCYLHNNKYHTDVPKCDHTQPKSNITVKCNKTKHKIVVQNSWSGTEIYKFLSFTLNIPFEKLKVIHKGKVLTTDNISDTVKSGSVYQVLGEMLESEDGVDQRDISVLMKQSGLDRNAAVLALKKKGDLLDVLLDQ